ncbi:Aste57867_12682 [Aphanomyces stellatus]|uniref:Aste57867_12682 protein n=1 Tax=Aphanomyces stellatus TaxID=120398 RepID=A0A485KW81_9STRA|nr:hypothetical protein As57867_012635 [Aphanomyces stellatus]VFT89532.1 Aste57867_12682 [Aphanomyces stellatus]
MSSAKYSPLSHRARVDTTAGRRRLGILVVVVGPLLWFGLIHLKARPATGATGDAFLQATFTVAHDPHFHARSPLNDTNDTHCHIQFVFAGPKYKYNQFSTMQSWIRYADHRCHIELIRPEHVVFNQLTLVEKEVLYDSADLPILQADFMKLLLLYYRGGLVTDLDVEALKPFPSAWTGPDTALATCHVMLGIEVNCYDDGCIDSMVRLGQIQNWSMWARRRHSPFVSELLEYVVAKYKTFPRQDTHVSVQEVFGSGSITDFVRLYGGFIDTTHYVVPTYEGGMPLARDMAGVLRIRKQDEEVCIVGPSWTGGGCGGRMECLLGHHFEGSWRNQWWPW